MKSKQTYKLIGFLVIAMLFMISKETFAAPAEVNMPSLNISFDGSETPADYVDNIKVFLFLTILTLLPHLLE